MTHSKKISPLGIAKRDAIATICFCPLPNSPMYWVKASSKVRRADVAIILLSAIDAFARLDAAVAARQLSQPAVCSCCCCGLIVVWLWAVAVTAVWGTIYIQRRLHARQGPSKLRSNGFCTTSAEGSRKTGRCGPLDRFHRLQHISTNCSSNAHTIAALFREAHAADYAQFPGNDGENENRVIPCCTIFLRRLHAYI